jgi:hypothetical protein
MNIFAMGHGAPADQGGRMLNSRAINALITRLEVIVTIRGGVGDTSARTATQGCAGRTSAAVWRAP